MHASSIIVCLGLLATAGLGPACNRNDDQGSGSARVSGGGDADTPRNEGTKRRGVEPAPARGEDNDERAGQDLPENREQFIADSRARIVEIDRKLERARLELEQRGQPMSAELEEERRILDRLLDDLQRAPADDWKQERDRLAERIDGLAFMLAKHVEPLPPHTASP